MAFVSFGTQNLRYQPTINITLEVESQTVGVQGQVRFRTSISSVYGLSYYGYTIRQTIVVGGQQLQVNYVLKANSPNTWTSPIVYTSPWFNYTGSSFTLQITTNDPDSANTSFSGNIPSSGGGGAIQCDYEGLAGDFSGGYLFLYGSKVTANQANNSNTITLTPTTTGMNSVIGMFRLSTSGITNQTSGRYIKSVYMISNKYTRIQ
jgi:hypothetical protein